MILCAWLCFDSSPRVHCQHYCFPALLVSLLVSSSWFTPGSCYLFSFSFIAPCVSLSFVRLLWLFPHCSDCIVGIAHLLSCLVQAPVLVTASLFPAPPLCDQINMGFLRQPPSLVSGLLSLSLGLASYLAGFISSATVAAGPAATVHPSVW